MSGLTSGRSMCGFAIVVAATCMLAAAAYAFSKEAVTDAQALLETVQRGLDVGDATPTDVAQVTHYLLEMKYRAGQIRLAEYCRTAKPSLELIVQGVREENLGGRRTTREVIEVKRAWFQFKAMCGGG